MLKLFLIFLALVAGLSVVITIGAFTISKKRGFKGRCEDAGAAGVVALTALPCIIGPAMLIWNMFLR